MGNKQKDVEIRGGNYHSYIHGQINFLLGGTKYSESIHLENMLDMVNKINYRNRPHMIKTPNERKQLKLMKANLTKKFENDVVLRMVT